MLGWSRRTGSECWPTDYAVPRDRPLADLTAELTTVLGCTDPQVRDGIAYPTLATWLERGVYDDLLPGLGDGMPPAWLRAGERRHRHGLPAQLLRAGARRVHRRATTPSSWCRRGADAVGRPGGHLAAPRARPARLRARQGLGARRRPRRRRARRAGPLPALRRRGLSVLLDVIADRLVTDTQYRWVHGEDDRLAHATMAILRRNLLAWTCSSPG